MKYKSVQWGVVSPAQNCLLRGFRFATTVWFATSQRADWHAALCVHRQCQASKNTTKRLNFLSLRACKVDMLTFVLQAFSYHC